MSRPTQAQREDAVPEHRFRRGAAADNGAYDRSGKSGLSSGGIGLGMGGPGGGLQLNMGGLPESRSRGGDGDAPEGRFPSRLDPGICGGVAPGMGGGGGEPPGGAGGGSQDPELVLSQTGTFEVHGWRIPKGGLARNRSDGEGVATGAGKQHRRKGGKDTDTAPETSSRLRGKASSSSYDYDFRKESIRISLLGKGASGTVYKMLHVPSLTLVAAKMVPVFDPEKRHELAEELNALYNNLTPFENVVRTRNRDLEAAAVAARSGRPSDGMEELERATPCPYIVSFYDAFSDGGAGTVTFVMEYMNAGSLEELVDAGGCESEAVLASVSWQVLQGLNFLHKNRQVHRDLKPCNILLNHEGDVKLADFGVSKHLSGSASEEMLETWVGTLTFMSPERVAGEPYTYNSDIWSFGLTMLSFATGKPPFDEYNSYFDVLHQLQYGDPPELPADRFSEMACDFFKQALRRDPQERPSAEQLLRHPFLAGVEERVTRRQAEREVHPPRDYGPSEEDVSDLTRAELNELVSKVQKYRYNLALREGLEEMPPIRSSRMRWLARQLDVPVGLVRRRFAKTQDRCTASLRKHARQRRSPTREERPSADSATDPAFDQPPSPDRDVEAALAQRYQLDQDEDDWDGSGGEGDGNERHSGEERSASRKEGDGLAPAVSFPVFAPSSATGGATSEDVRGGRGDVQLQGPPAPGGGARGRRR